MKGEWGYPDLKASSGAASCAAACPWDTIEWQVGRE